MTTWERLADITLGSSGDKLDSGTITAYHHLKVVIHTIATGGNIKENITFNNDGGGNYNRARSNDGASDSTDTNQTQLEVYGDGAQDRYLVLDILNDPSEPKMVIGRYNINTVGAGNAPTRSEWIGYWNNTSSQITQIEVDNDGTGSYDTLSQMTIWGADDAVLNNVYPSFSNGTIFEDSTNGKHYMWDGTSAWNEMS